MKLEDHNVSVGFSWKRPSLKFQYYPKWRWPWWNRLHDPDLHIVSNSAGVGPFQWSWYSDE